MLHLMKLSLCDFKVSETSKETQVDPFLQVLLAKLEATRFVDGADTMKLQSVQS